MLSCATPSPSPLEQFEKRQLAQTADELLKFESEIRAVARGNQYFRAGGTGMGFNPCKKVELPMLTKLTFIDVSASKKGNSSTDHTELVFKFTNDKNEDVSIFADISPYDYTNRTASGVLSNCFMKAENKKKYKYSKADMNLMESGKIRIGFTPEQTIISVGSPQKINRTVTSRNERQQWVFKERMYLYFENGTLVSFQSY